MKKLISILSVLFLVYTAVSETATLAWNPNTEMNVASYRIYYTTNKSTIFTNDSSLNFVTNFVQVNHPTTMVDVTNLNVGTTYAFAATAFNTDGLESLYGNSVTYTVPGESTNVVYAGIKLEWWTVLANKYSSNFNLTAFIDPPNPQYYRSYLILTNSDFVNTNKDFFIITKVRSRLEWWTNMMSVNRQYFDLISFTNPPIPQYYRSSLIITNKPF